MQSINILKDIVEQKQKEWLDDKGLVAAKERQTRSKTASVYK